MCVAALYDIHGNLPALEAVLQDVAGLGLDAVVCGGDVFPGPMGCECLHALQALDIPVHYVMGNGDREVLAARSGATTRRSSPDSRQTRRQLRWQGRSWPRPLPYDALSR